MPFLGTLTPFTFRLLGGVWKLASSEVQFANDVLDFFQTSFKTSRSMFCQKHRLKIASLIIIIIVATINIIIVIDQFSSSTAGFIKKEKLMDL